jgi:hypothetical protein
VLRLVLGDAPQVVGVLARAYLRRKGLVVRDDDELEVLLRAARGDVVDEAALLEALEAGRLAGAGLDVFPIEPPDPNAPLYRHPRVVTLPHVGSVTEEAYEVRVRVFDWWLCVCPLKVWMCF